MRARCRLVNRLADVMEAHLEELFALETLNNGRPIRETRAQIARVPDLFRYNASLAMARRDSVIPVEGDYHAFTNRLPVGVVAPAWLSVEPASVGVVLTPAPAAVLP